MSLTITRVRRMADLPDVLAENIRSWPHYQCSPDTPDAYTTEGHTFHDGRPIYYDPLTSEDGERGERKLTGYAEAGTTPDGYRLWVLRFLHWGRETFTYGYMPPGSTWLTVGARDDQDTKANIETWVDFQMRVDIAGARTAGTVAYNVGRPNEPVRYGDWGRRVVADPGMEPLLDMWGYGGLGSDRLVRAFKETWEANATHDRLLAQYGSTGACAFCAAQVHLDGPVWVDNSGGDVCGVYGTDNPHIPSTDEATDAAVRHETEAQALRDIEAA